MANSKDFGISLDLKSSFIKAARCLQPPKVINAQQKYSLHECCALRVPEQICLTIRNKMVHLVIIIHIKKLLCVVAFNVGL